MCDLNTWWRHDGRHQYQASLDHSPPPLALLDSLLLTVVFFKICKRDMGCERGFHSIQCTQAKSIIAKEAFLQVLIVDKSIIAAGAIIWMLMCMIATCSCNKVERIKWRSKSKIDSNLFCKWDIWYCRLQVHLQHREGPVACTVDASCLLACIQTVTSGLLATKRTCK